MQLDRRLAVVIPAAVMLGVGWWGIDRGSMWQDEEATVNAARRSLAEIWAMVHHVDVVHALYYVLMHIWMQAGGGEVWLRVPSVLATSVSAALISAIGGRLVRPAAGLWSGLLFCSLPLVSHYAQEARSFALVCSLVLLSCYFLVRALEDGDRRWWFVYAAATASAVVLHEFALLVLLAHAATLLLSRQPVRAWLRWGGGALTCGLVVAPLAWISSQQSAQVNWLSRPNLDTVPTVTKAFLGSSPVAMAVMGGLIIVGLTVAARPTPVPGAAPQIRLTNLAAPLMLLPGGVLLLISLVRPLFMERYVLYSVAGVALLAGAGAAQLAVWSARPWIARSVAALVLITLVVAQFPAQHDLRSVTSRGNDLAGVARSVQTAAQPGDGVLFMPSRYRAVALAYPESFRGLSDLSMAETPIQAANLRGIDKSRRKTREAMLATSRIWVVGRTKLRVGQNEPGALNEQNVLRVSFVRKQSVQVHGMEVSLFVRR